MSADAPVTVDVGDRRVPLQELVERFERGERLSKQEIDALVEYPATGVDVAEWRRLKAKALFGANPHHEGDEAAEQAAVEWLRDIFADHGVEDVEDYTALLEAVSDDHPVQDAVRRLTENATAFEERREDSLLARLEEREQQPVEELYRPDDADEDWDPATDQGLHEFIAGMEQAGDGLLESLDQWEELKEAAKFDPAEWGLEEDSTDAGGA